MKTQILYLFVSLFISCTPTNQKKESETKTIVKTEDLCSRKAKYSSVEICLPEIDGMTECYLTPNVKSRVDMYNLETNTQIGYYLNNETYKLVDNFQNISVDDYIQVFALTRAKDVVARAEDLKYINDMMSSNYSKADWEEVKNKLKDKYNNITLSQPIVIEKYSPIKNAESMIILSKTKSGNEEFISLSIFNSVLIKNRIIWATYNLTYEGVESIKKAKGKNDYFINLFVTANK